MAFGGVTAMRGKPVRGETRAPKTRQWAGTRDSSLRGKLTDTFRHGLPCQERKTRAGCKSKLPCGSCYPNARTRHNALAHECSRWVTRIFISVLQASRRRGRLLQRAAYLESETAAIIRTSTALFRRVGFHLIAHAGFGLAL